MTTAIARTPKPTNLRQACVSRFLIALAVAVLCLAPPGPAQAADVFPELILERFRAAGLPMQDVVIFDETNDPNELLGRPGQYFAKAEWFDRRGDREAHGTFEIFRTPADLERRRAYMEPFTILPIWAEYMYVRDPVLLRMWHTLTPGEAAEYDRVLGDAVREP